MVTAVVLELKVYLLLTDQVKLAAVGKGLELGVLIFQIPDTSAEFFNFAGISEINDQTDGFLFHTFRRTVPHNRVKRNNQNKNNRNK